MVELIRQFTALDLSPRRVVDLVYVHHTHISEPLECLLLLFLFPFTSLSLFAVFQLFDHLLVAVGRERVDKQLQMHETSLMVPLHSLQFQSTLQP